MLQLLSTTHSISKTKGPASVGPFFKKGDNMPRPVAPTGLGDALKKYFGTGTPRGGTATTNLITLRKQLTQAIAQGDDAAAKKIQQQIAALTR
jgi:hypothetical protein